MTEYVVMAEGVRETLDASSEEEAREQAADWLREGDYGSLTSTIWVDGSLLADGERVDTVTVAIDPDEPRCIARGEDHDWQAPHALVGGLEENPGVHGHGGGVTITEACVRCGCQRVRDTWASRPDTGEQGLESLCYETSRYVDEIEVAS